MLQLHTIKPNPGAKHRKKRLGNGESSGLGKTCGKGNKGQKARSGGTIRPGFEGGQMPLHRRLPKKGFNNTRFQDKILIVNLSQLERVFEAGATVDENTLRAAKLVQGPCDAVKLLGNGTLTKNLNVVVDFVSASLAKPNHIWRTGSCSLTRFASLCLLLRFPWMPRVQTAATCKPSCAPTFILQDHDIRICKLHESTGAQAPDFVHTGDDCRRPPGGTDSPAGH